MRLEQNYRSTPGIIESANRLMKGRPGALTLHSPPDTEVSTAAARPPLIDGFDSDTSEARAVASAVAAEIADGTKPENIAILFRINVQAAAIEAALNAQQVPYLVRGATRFFELREIKEALMMFKGASVSIQGEPLFKTVSDVLRSLGWTQEAPETRGAVRDRWEALNALMGLAEQTPAGTTLKDFVDDLFERQAAPHEPTLSAVTIATLHSAKGLEWDSVHLVGISEGLVPISYAKTAEAIDEERRLLYVGITRARTKLSLTWAASGGGSGGGFRAGQRQASRFLAELQR